jgi:hypothetical protein
MIPPDYYKTAGGAHQYYGGFVTVVGTDEIKRNELCKLPDSIITALQIGCVKQINTYLGFKAHGANTVGFYVWIKEIGFWSVKSIATLDQDIYAGVKGETVANDGTTETNNVYGAFKHILEDYDLISAASIDYSNLPTTRIDWPVSRQMTEKKNSFDYLKELAEQSLVCIFPTRKGVRKLMAWRDNTTNVVNFTQANILRDSIASWTKTELLNMFNKFTLQYQYNIATKKFERSLQITNVSAASFPLISDETWKTYVSGLNPNSYQEAKSVWLICHDAYTKSLQESLAPDNMSKLYWYVDSGDMASVNDSAYKLLINLVEWSTRQKETVTFKIPLNATTLTYELLDYIHFSDDIFTNSVSRPGWITAIEADPNNSTITLSCTLEPIELYDDTVIIERGKFLNIDMFDEGINQTNTVDEPM